MKKRPEEGKRRGERSRKGVARDFIVYLLYLSFSFFFILSHKRLAFSAYPRLPSFFMLPFVLVVCSLRLALPRRTFFFIERSFMNAWKLWSKYSINNRIMEYGLPNTSSPYCISWNVNVTSHWCNSLVPRIPTGKAYICRHFYPAHTLTGLIYEK